MIAIDVRECGGSKLEEWARESRNLAMDVVYDGVDQNHWPRLAADLASDFLPAAIVDPVLAACLEQVSTPIHLSGIPEVEPSEASASVATDLMLIGLLELSGQRVFAYQEQKSGALVQDIIPIPGKEQSNSNAGRVALGWHTDDAVFAQQFRAERLALLGLVNEAESRTSFVMVDSALEMLDEETVRTLLEPRFRFATPESFEIFGGKLVYSELRPLIRWCGDKGWHEVACAEYSTTTAPWDDQARESLQRFQEALSKAPRKSVVIKPGDCLILSNTRGLHSRDAINGKRHLKRAYMRSDLSDLQLAAESADSDERVFSCESFILLK